MTPAVSYLRVSSTNQLAGDGFPRQREAIERYALANGYQIVQEFSDDISGKTELDNRPGLAACMERIENNGVKVVLCESSDRLARDAMVSELIIRQMQKVGGTIITVSGVNLTEGGDNSPTAALIRGVLALIAEFDRRVIVLKLRAARERKKSNNGRCEGVKPFGMLTGEQITLEKILELHKLKNSADSIASYLNHFNHYNTRSGAPWRASTIRKILSREKAS